GALRGRQVSRSADVVPARAQGLAGGRDGPPGDRDVLHAHRDDRGGRQDLPARAPEGPGRGGRALRARLHPPPRRAPRGVDPPPGGVPRARAVGAGSRGPRGARTSDTRAAARRAARRPLGAIAVTDPNIRQVRLQWTGEGLVFRGGPDGGPVATLDSD